MTGSVSARARSAWASFAGLSAAVEPGGRTLVRSGSSGICPPGWCGVVELDGSVVAVAPPDLQDERAGQLLGDWRTLGASELLGPADLWFSTALPGGTNHGAEEIESTDPRLGLFRERQPATDLAEADFAHCARVFATSDGDRITAVAGFERWPSSVAHICVITDHEAQRRGLGRSVASAAIAAALNEGLLIQWRARPAASIALARSLGLTRLGSQVSLRLP